MAQYNIFLIGHTGCGKTAVGKALARYLGCEFCDTDSQIEVRTGMAIADIFQQKGESYFRDCETRLLRELVKRTGLVIATGGGMVVDAQNGKLMKQSGVVVYLQVARRMRLARIGDGSGRPLLYGKSEAQIASIIERMEVERSPIYQEIADLTVEHATDLDATADRIVQMTKQYEKDPHRSL